MKSNKEIEDAIILASDGWYRNVHLRKQPVVNYGTELYKVKQTQNIGPGSYSYSTPDAKTAVRIGERCYPQRVPDIPGSNHYSPSNSYTTTSGPRDIVMR